MKSRFKKAGVTLGTSYVLEHMLVLLRTIIVARAIGLDNFGIAATFIIVVSTFAMISDLGIEKYLIHAHEKDISVTTASLASVLLARGLILGLSIWFASGWIAALFGHAELSWIYACAALVPVVEGFRHLDPLRQQRVMNFLPSIKVQLGSLIPGVTITIILAILTESYIAIVFGSLLTAILSVLLSHLLATTRYRLGFDWAAVGGLFTYGWPLMLNGMIIFIGTQGDRIVVGMLEGIRDLGGYVAIGSLTVGLSLFLAKLCGNLYLPLLSGIRDDPALYARQSLALGSTAMIMLSCTLLPMALLGAPVVSLLFGEEYRIPPVLAAFLSIQAAAVVLRAWPVVIALSLGSTRDILISNLVRVAGLAAAIIAVSKGYGVVGVAACMAAGDVLGTLVALWRSCRRTPAVASMSLLLGAVFCGLSGLAVMLNLLTGSDEGWVLPLLAALVVSALGVVSALLASADLRRSLFGRLFMEPRE